MTKDDLKHIYLYRQHLTNKTDKLTVCHDLNGIQSQFTVNVYYSLLNRCSETITSENYGEGLLKNWTVRGTVHAFAQEDLPVFLQDTDILFSQEWESSYYGDKLWVSGERKQYFSKFIIDLVGQGIGERDELKKRCVEEGMTKVEESFIFDSWGGLLRPMCERGFLSYKVKEKKEFQICPQFSPIGAQKAEYEKVKRYFEHFAPSTIKDAAYYFHWPQSKIKEIINKMPVKSIIVDGKKFFYLGEIDDNYPDIPKCILLAGFDQLMLGYLKTENIFLPEEHLRGIFNLAGIVLPPIILNGRVVGKWKKQKNNMIFTLFEHVNAKEKKYIIDSMESMFPEMKKVSWE